MKLVVPLRGETKTIELIPDVHTRILDGSKEHARNGLNPVLALLGPKEYYSLKFHMERVSKFPVEKLNGQITLTGPVGPLTVFLVERDGIEYAFEGADLHRLACAKWTL